MVTFNAVLQKFKDKGEKTGWTYITIPENTAHKLKANTKTSFRVKGKLDKYAIKQVALLPMGDGDFIMAINATMRKGIGKRQGNSIKVSLEIDKSDFVFSEDFLTCLEDEPKAMENFKRLPPSHQKYYSKWIESAKSEQTKVKRITQSVQGLAMGLKYNEMVRYFREEH